MLKVCENCGKLFEVSKSKYTKRKNCSLKCWREIGHSKETKEKLRKVETNKYNENKEEYSKHKSLIRKGAKMPKEAKNKISISLLGNKRSKGKLVMEKSPFWKGENATYEPKHAFVSRKKGKPLKCEHCGKEGGHSRFYHWANIDHKYSRKLEDYIRLCVSCHIKYDKDNNGYKHFGK